MSQVTGQAFNYSLLKRVLVYIRPYRTVFIWAMVLTVLLALISLVRPILIGYTLDNYIFKNDYSGLVNMTFVMLFSLVLQTFLQYTQLMLTNKLGQSAVRDLRINVFKHITKLKLRYFDRTPIGQLITRTVSDMETISDIFSEGLIAIIGDLLMVVVIFSWMMYKDWELSLVILLPIPFLILATSIFQRAIKVAFQQVRTEVSNLNTYLQEHITGISIIQYFARESQEYRKFKKINARYRDANI
ncbi:MAG: ABC transporter ATP-binding protein, partial [Pedobacter sp.]